MDVTKEKDGVEFSRALLAWFARAMRPLPWRGDYEPYRVWISEIMLQQTQMERGVEYFLRWMRLFPAVRDVAEAEESAVLAAWEGLGYYSRARNLRKAARVIMERHGGEFPRDYDAIRALPGVGEYTAGAISSIAFNQPRPAVDANVLRIFSRVRDMESPVDSAETRRGATEWVRRLTPEGKAREFCQALMELGALVCGKTPRCAECPVAAFCLAEKRGTTGERPVKKAGAGYKILETVAALLVRAGEGGEEELFIRQRPAAGLWANLWEFPGGEVFPGESPEDAVVRHLGGVDAGGLERIGTVKHGYTTNRVTLRGYAVRVGEGVSAGILGDADAGNEAGNAAERAGEWVARAALSAYAFPAGHRKLLEILGWK